MGVHLPNSVGAVAIGFATFVTQDEPGGNALGPKHKCHRGRKSVAMSLFGVQQKVFNGINGQIIALQRLGVVFKRARSPEVLLENADDFFVVIRGYRPRFGSPTFETRQLICSDQLLHQIVGILFERLHADNNLEQFSQGGINLDRQTQARLRRRGRHLPVGHF